MNRPTRKAAWLALLLLGWSGLSHAEAEDRDKPIHLEADRVVVDDIKQTSVFEGKVHLTQGTLLVEADKIVLTQDKQGYKHCTATGNPASFRQKREDTDEYLEGYGERIEYDTRTETVDFFGHARVQRDQDEVRGDHIAYSTSTETFQAVGSEGGAEEGRVHAVIQPKSKEPNAQPKEAPINIQPSQDLSK